MKHLKKLWIGLIALLPGIAKALPLPVLGLLIGGGVIGLGSLYRSIVPVDTAQAFGFFSGCWSCQMFTDIMTMMSGVLPGIYRSLGTIMIAFMGALTFLWFAWSIFKGYTEGKIESAWDTTGRFGTHLIKFAVAASLLVAPLPRMLNDLIIEPVFSIGQAVTHAVTEQVTSTTNDTLNFNSCLVATSIMDPQSESQGAYRKGAFSPRLRNGLACELVSIHKLTAVGMTVGWTMMNMAFDFEYMSKILWDIVFFPNIPIILAGLLILVLFFTALLPIPVYFLEIFIKLSLDLIMLPIMLLSWLFSDWKVINKTKTIREVVDDIITGVVGITMTCIFATFAILFLNQIFANTGFETLSELLQSGNDNSAKMLMDALMMRNDSLITMILMGIFMAMFMTSIPQLVKTLFKVNISDDFYNSAKKDLNTVWGGVKKIFQNQKK